MGRRKEYPDDDGRTVADMSGLGARPSLFPKREKRDGADSAHSADSAGGKKDGLFLTKAERAAYLLGTLKSALLIGTVFAAAFALLILGMIVVWHW